MNKSGRHHNSNKAPLEQCVLELNASEARFRTIIKKIADGIVVVDREGKVCFVNPAAESILGRKAKELMGELFGFPVVPDETTVVDIFRPPQAGGERAVVEMRATEIEWDGKSAYLASLRDITESKRLQERLDYIARYDPITGLPNRSLFCDRLNQALALAQRQKRQMAVMSVYPDSLGRIFTLVGRQACNFSFQTMAKRLCDSVRRSDVIASIGEKELNPIVCRLGEYEFAVLLPEITGAQDAARVAHRILDVLSQPIVVEDQKFTLPVCIGISIYPSDGDNEETLLKNATIAMSNVEKKDISDFQFYSPEIGARVSERLTLENSLHKALEQKEFLVHYQPIVNINTGQIVSMEALVRWRHPDRGLVSPMEFIPLAEETGLIVHIGEWVLRTACAQNRAWYDAGYPPIRISVNFSVRQFQQQNPVGIITRVIKETGLDPHLLELEITESVLTKGNVAVATFRELNEMGMQISIDDFGTGYSSLSYLKLLPVNNLKIDKSFVSDITRHPDTATIVTATITMAHNLHLKVIAEGVETVEQLEFLRSLKCNEMQGYLFSKPLPAEEATKLLAEGKRLELPIKTCISSPSKSNFLTFIRKEK